VSHIRTLDEHHRASAGDHGDVMVAAFLDDRSVRSARIDGAAHIVDPNQTDIMSDAMIDDLICTLRPHRHEDAINMIRKRVEIGIARIAVDRPGVFSDGEYRVDVRSELSINDVGNSLMGGRYSDNGNGRESQKFFG
jgi:hypothetical protein